ncbi:MAG: hypothetical protein ACMX3H_10020 [Sodalis sp. (in: enterobacteria)]|uniref:hypothetical protein n=1 Tax=Sodalis sp. (in: enterobacteria) TaxID=1898979 RepID=UPI0039E6893E
MPLRIRLLQLLSAMMLAGCALPYGLHTEGRALDANTLAGQQTFSSAKLSSASWPAADWWNSLGDSNLDALIRRTLQNSPDLQVADARVDDYNGQGKQYGTVRTLSADFNYTFDLWGGQRTA